MCFAMKLNVRIYRSLISKINYAPVPTFVSSLVFSLPNFKMRIRTLVKLIHRIRNRPGSPAQFVTQMNDEMRNYLNMLRHWLLTGFQDCWTNNSHVRMAFFTRTRSFNTFNREMSRSKLMEESSRVVNYLNFYHNHKCHYCFLEQLIARMTFTIL